MSNYATLKAAISTAIKQNGNEEITGQVLQTTLLSMVDSLVSGYLFKGIATPSTVVGTPDENVFWLAPAGSYSNFGATPIDVPTGCIGVFQYDGSFTNTVVYVGGTVDISALSHTSYASLSQALGDLPAALHIGGIEVRYQDSTTSKFVKYRLMATSWSTTESDWQGVDDEPTAGSDNLVKSGGVQNELALGSVYNVSAHNNNTTFESLSALLSNANLNTLIPTAVRKGGMSIKFVQTSDNKYVQCRLNTTSFSTNPDDWQIINDVPAVENEQTDDLQLTDENDNVLAAFRNGGFRTKNFNTENVYNKEDINDNFPKVDDDVDDLSFTDENDLKIFRIKNGYPQTKNFDGSKLSPNIFNQVRSSIGEGQMRTSYATIASDAVIHLTDFPRYIDTRKFVSLIGYMDSFPSNTHFDFGFRYKYNNQYWHSGGWIRVTTTSVEIYHDSNEDVSSLEQSYTHGLTLTTFVKVFMYLREDYSLYIILETLDGKYVIEHNRDNVEDKEIVGHPTFINSGVTFANAQITAGSADFKSPIWIFGDSYSTASYGYSRIGGQLMDLGLTQNTCYNHLGGNNHQDAWDDLQLMLAFGTPRMIIWLLGVNGSQPNNVTITGMLKEFCESKNIELVLEYPPLYPNSVGIDTTNLRAKVLETGCRIVDFSRAVGCHIVSDDAVWYDGYLQGDKIHPTEKGSRALVMQIINDVPEILQWGVNEHPVYYSASNN